MISEAVVVDVAIEGSRPRLRESWAMRTKPTPSQGLLKTGRETQARLMGNGRPVSRFVGQKDSRAAADGGAAARLAAGRGVTASSVVEGGMDGGTDGGYAQSALAPLLRVSRRKTLQMNAVGWSIPGN